MAKLDVVLLNIGDTPTNVKEEATSILDFTFVSSSLTGGSYSWRVMSAYTASDHSSRLWKISTGRNPRSANRQTNTVGWKVKSFDPTARFVPNFGGSKQSRLNALRVASAFRLVSEETVCIISKTLPIRVLAEEIRTLSNEESQLHWVLINLDQKNGSTAYVDSHCSGMPQKRNMAAFDRITIALSTMILEQSVIPETLVSAMETQRRRDTRTHGHRDTETHGQPDT
ncbi:hypothetical protein EVAR_34393_1 [Eumeta japonica]|uniref:Uncharacterized protein n=1 Tax=Eumeta variegata TaxID=151549 RepID=A0A4C1WZQ0_EUMVA|nr:hypothetical protein EVAR_34393_1 [Eumeta japonica]